MHSVPGKILSHAGTLDGHWQKPTVTKAGSLATTYQPAIRKNPSGQIAALCSNCPPVSPRQSALEIENLSRHLVSSSILQKLRAIEPDPSSFSKKTNLFSLLTDIFLGEP